MEYLDDSELTEIIYSPVCSFCAHLLGKRECKAFKKIPEKIWTGENNHTKPSPGDNGLRFQDKRSD